MSKLSVTDVRHALKCPRFFVLCKKYGKKSWVYSGRFVGSIVHDTMQKSFKDISNPMIFTKAFKDSIRSKKLVEKIVENFLYKHFCTVVRNRLDKMGEISQIPEAWRLVRSAKSRVADLIVKTATITPLEEVPKRLILGVEKPFKTKIKIGDSKVTLAGRIDAALRDPETDEVLLWDFKTGGPKNIQLDAAQLALYSYAIEELWHEKPNAKILYFFEDGLRSVEVPKPPELRSDLFEYMFRMVKWLRGEEVPPQADPETCMYCHLKISCDEVFHNIPPIVKIVEELREKIRKVTEKEKLKEKLVEERKGFLQVSSNVRLDLDKFLRHGAIIGSTGCGKTYLAKVIIEEILLLGKNVLIIDPQGDLASLALFASEEGKMLLENVEVNIYTPASRKGLNLTLDPFALPPVRGNMDEVDFEEYEAYILDNISSTLLNILDMKPSKSKSEKAFLEAVIKEIWKEGEKPTFINVANLVNEIAEITPIKGGEKVSADNLLSKTKRKKLSQGLLAFAVGTEGTLFAEGEKLCLEEPVNGKPRLNIIHMGGIGTDQKKRQMVLSWILRAIYDWMLRNPPKKESLRLFFYIDEVADFLPPHPRSPPSKKMLTLLLRQARKYGVGCMIATQSPGNIEYKALDNVLTLFIGRIPTPQSVKKIMDNIAYRIEKQGKDPQTIIERFMTATPGQFFIVSEEIESESFTSRKLLTQHKTLSLDEVQKIVQSK